MVNEAGRTWVSFLGWILFAVILLALTGTEACYFLGENSPVRRIAALIWIVVSTGFLLSVIFYSFRTFLQKSFWRDKDRFWYLTAFFLPIVLVYFGVESVTWTPINNEGTQQVVQGMTLLKQDPDFGVYRITYFVGYVARQYLLACLPTFFFGPSLLALRVGTSFIYMGSYLAFLSALANYFRVRGAANPLVLASFAGMMIALGEYPLLNARVFEQTTMPIGATLLFLAGVFNFLSGPTPYRTFWVAWSFGFFVEGYTPGLGAWWMAFFVLLYLALHPKYKYRILFAPIIYGACCMVVACLLLHSSNALLPRFYLGSPHFTSSDWVWRYFLGFRSLLSLESSVLPCPLGLAAMTVLYFSFKFRDYRFPILCVWCIGVSFVSLTCLGSNFNLPQFDIHRAMIILPPLAAGVVVFYHVYSPQFSPSPWVHRTVVACACVAMIYIVCASAAVPLAVRNFVYYHEVSDCDEALYDVDCLNFDPKMEKVKKIYIVPPLRIDDLGIGLEYFSPSAVVIHGNPPPGEKDPGAYVLSYRSDNMTDRVSDIMMPSRHPRPYLQLKPE